jgi:hypothetical protein
MWSWHPVDEAHTTAQSIARPWKPVNIRKRFLHSLSLTRRLVTFRQGLLFWVAQTYIVSLLYLLELLAGRRVALVLVRMILLCQLEKRKAKFWYMNDFILGATTKP